MEVSRYRMHPGVASSRGFVPRENSTWPSFDSTRLVKYEVKYEVRAVAAEWEILRLRSRACGVAQVLLEPLVMGSWEEKMLAKPSP